MGKTPDDRLPKEALPVQLPSDGNHLRKVIARAKTFLVSLSVKSPTLWQPKTLQPAAAGTPFSPASQDILNAKRQVEQILKDNILPFWFPQVIDTIHGGYRLNHDLQGRWKGPAARCLVTQARTLWFFSRLSRSRWGVDEHLEAARHGFQFLRDVMWDRQFGGFYWEMDAVEPIPQDASKRVYGQAFGLYALSEYARVSKDSSAIELAQHLFWLLDKQVHDSHHGGYYELCSRDWQRVPLELPSSPHFPVFIKTMNTHLHMLEAITTYYSVSQDPIARERLMELLFILSNAVLRKKIGACTDKHFPDWTPLNGHKYELVSYGHDLEAIWLLSETCDVVGLPKEPFFDLYQTIFDYAYRFGFDQKAGGIYSKGFFNKPAHKRRKIWWVQAEGLVSALHLYQLMKRERYWKCFTLTLEWIFTHQVDWNHGDWYEQIEPEGYPTGGKSGNWKSPYHNGRAMLQCSEILNQLTEK